MAMKVLMGRCILGCWIRADQKGTVEQYEDAVGWRMGNVAFFANWGREVGLSRLRLLPSGVMPIPNINLKYGDASNSNMDILLREFEAFGRPVLLRYGGEMDRPRGGKFIDPSAYKKDWERVRSYIRERYPQADFAWNPTAMGLNPQQGLRALPYWPGSEQVDIPSLDGYDTAGNNHRSFQTIMQPGVDFFAEHAPGKWLAVLETGVTYDRTDDYRSQWLTDMAKALQGPLSAIKIVTYFDSKPPSEAGVDWRLNPGTKAWKTWQGLHDATFFHGRTWKVQPK